MRASLRIAWLVSLVSATAASTQEEVRNPLENAAPLTLTGRVERVFTTKKQRLDDESDTLYVIEVNVASGSKVDGKAE